MKRWICNRNLIYIIILNITLMMITLLCFSPTYENGDDFMMGLISTGVFGDEYRQSLVFSNIIYGYILKFLGSIISSLNWYTIFQYFLILVSIIVIIYIVYQCSSLCIALTIDALLWYIIFFDLFRRVQFTRTAGITIVAGCMVLWYSFKKSNKLLCLIGAILCIMGGLLRRDCLPLCTSFFVALGIVICITKRINRNTLIKGIITIVSIAFIFGGCCLLDKLYYTTQESWNRYIEYNKVRSDVMDYALPDYNSNLAQYDELGLSKNDITILKRWMLADFDKFDYDTLKALSEMKEGTVVTKDIIKSYMLDFVQRNYTNILFYVWIVLVLTCFSLNKTCKAYALIDICGVGSIYFYLYYIGRLIARVEFAIWFSAVFSMLACILSFYSLKPKWKPQHERKILVNILLFIGIFLAGKCVNENVISKVQYRQEPAGLFKKLSKNESNVYLMDVLSFGNVCYCYKPYLKVPDYFMSNLYYTGGWDINTPFNKDQLEELGLENPVKDLLYQDNIYYVKNTSMGIDLELQYLRENYNEAVDVAVVEEYATYTIYKFHVKND